MRRFVEPGIPVVLRTACTALQREVAHPQPWLSVSRAGSQMHGIHEISAACQERPACPDP